MQETIIRLLSKIYYEFGDVYKHIFSFYNNEYNRDDDKLENFIKCCQNHNILNNPYELLYFLDTMGIKLAVMPIINTNEWTYRIYTEKDVLISDNYGTRSEAFLVGLEECFLIYKKYIK